MQRLAHAVLRLLAAGTLVMAGRAFSQDAAANPPEANLCSTRSEPVALGSALWNGWGRDLDSSRYQPEPALRANDVAKLKLKWAFGYPADTEAGQPTVVDGRVFLTSSAGRVYSIDAETGCIYWSYNTRVGSRSTVFIAELGQEKRAPAQISRKIKRTLAHLDVIKSPSAAVFGDDSGAVLALDAQKGTLLWKTQVDSHPLARIVAAPVRYGVRVYVSVTSTEESMAQQPGYACCTFRGSVAALDLQNGRIVWKTYTVLQEPAPTRKSADGVQEYGPAGAAVAGTPAIDAKRGVLYVATGQSLTSVEQSLTDAVAAFGLEDGRLRWVKQLTRTGEIASSSFLASPLLRSLAAGNDVLLAGQRSGVMYGLDPDHGGEILWQTRVANGISGSASTPSAHNAAAADGGIAWGAAADHRNVYVPLTGALAQPPNQAGSLTALDMKTGIARWHVASAPAAQAVSVMPGTAFSGAADGHIRAYSTIDGRVQWDFDTAKTFTTVNGQQARGGVLDHGGPTIVNGTVYINSGNALLAFSVDGK